MDQSWLLDAKLRAPVPPADRVRRSFADLPEPLPPFVALEGGPGAGKTLALAELMGKLAKGGTTTLWYGLDPDDADPATFFTRLVAGARQQVPGLGEAVLAMVRDGRLAPRGLWRAFFGDVGAFGVPAFALALDDAHHLLPTPELVAALTELAELFPPPLRVLASARRPLPIGRLLAAGRAARLDDAALRFSPEEVARYLTARARGRAVPTSWTERAPALEGWPLGLALVTAGGPALAGRQTEGGDALEAYVADALYHTQAPERRAFMLRAALLPQLDVETAAALGEPGAGALLAGLQADHLVRRLEGAAGPGGGYAFPAHLRDFLRAEAVRAIPAAELQALHARLGELLGGRGQPALALAHFIAAQAWPGALQAASEAFPALRHEGRHAEIERHLAAFPTAVREAEPVLALWEAHGHLRGGRSGEASDAYERARAGFAARDDVAGELAALARLAAAAAHAGDLQRFNRLLVLASARAAEARPEDLAELHLARALLAERRGDPALARECNEAVLALASGARVDVAAAHGQARLNLAEAALRAGELDQALRHAGHAREAAATRGLTPLAVAAAFVEARVLLARGEAGAAAVAIANVPPDWPDLLDWHLSALAHVVVGTLRGAEEAWDEAEASLRAALGRYEAAGSHEGRKIALEAFCRLALRRRQYARVEALAADAGLSEAPEDWNAFDLAIVLPRARARHLAGDPAAAASQLASAIPGLASQGLRLSLTRAHFYDAAARLEAGEEAAARQAQAAGEALRAQHGYDFLAAVEPALWRALAPLREGVPSQPAPRPAAVPAAKAPRAPEAPAGAGDAPALTLVGFGRIEVRLGDQPLDRWPRRKAKLALAALALRRGVVPSFELGELLGDGDSTSGHGILKVTMPALRRTLEPALAQGAASAYIRTGGDGYALIEALVDRCDVHSFEGALARARASRDAAPDAAAAALEEALALYRGDLFDEPLLAGAFEAERTAYRRQALEAAFWLADRRASLGDATGREAWLTRAMQVAPVEEEVYVRLMQHHMAVGRPERVRQAYWDCRKALKRHLDFEPSLGFEEAYRALV